jgi:hypothetical protein
MPMNMSSELLCLTACGLPTQVAFFVKQVGIECNRASDLSSGFCPMFKADLDMGKIVVSNKVNLQEAIINHSPRKDSRYNGLPAYCRFETLTARLSLLSMAGSGFLRGQCRFPSHLDRNQHTERKTSCESFRHSTVRLSSFRSRSYAASTAGQFLPSPIRSPWCEITHLALEQSMK